MLNTKIQSLANAQADGTKFVMILTVTEDSGDDFETDFAADSWCKFFF